MAESFFYYRPTDQLLLNRLNNFRQKGIPWGGT
jgi:hypothetical protein